MKKYIYSLIGIISLLGILFSFIPANFTFAADSKSDKTVGQEIVSLRTENSKTIYKGKTNGKDTYELQVSLSAIHYKDNYSNYNEQWKDIDTTIDASTGFNNKIPYNFTYNKSDKSLLITSRKTNSSIIIRIETIDNKPITLGEPIISGNKIIWQNIATDTDLQIISDGKSVKLQRVLKSNKAPLAATFTYAIVGSGIGVKCMAVDANGKYIPVTNTIGNNRITETIDTSNLSNIKYPIYIDPDITEIVGADADDTYVYWNGSAWVKNDITTVVMGYYSAAAYKSGAGFRFQTVAIPAGATIYTAHVHGTIYAKYSGTTGVNFLIVGDDEDDAAAFSTLADYQARRGTDVGGADNTKRTTAQVQWNNVPNDNVDVEQTSPDISTVVQEIVDRAGWASGNDMAIFVGDHDDRSTHTAEYIRQWYSYTGSTTKCSKLHITYYTDAVVTTSAATSVEATTATGNGEITDTGGVNASERGICYSSINNPPTVADSKVFESGSFGTGVFSENLSSLSTGTTYYLRAYCVTLIGTFYGSTVSILTKPAAPTDVSATDGTHTDKVVITWTKSTGATDYHVWRDASDLGAAGDVATFDDNTAAAPTITAGTATASDGTSSTFVTLSIAGESVSNGTTYTYKVVASNATGNSADSATNTGYRGHGTLTYQWYRSAADSDAAFSAIGGATTDPYNDAGGVVDPDGRYYYCALSATGATSQNTNHDRGYIANVIPPTAVTGICSGFTSNTAIINGMYTAHGDSTTTQWGFDYGLTTAYGSSVTSTSNLGLNTNEWYNLTGLTAGTVYHYRFKAYNVAAGWGYGADRYFSTKGSPVIYEYLNTGYDSDSPRICSSNMTAQQFTIGTLSHTITQANFYLKKVGSPGTVTVELKHASAGVVTGNAIFSTTFNGNNLGTSYAWIPITFTTETGVQAGQQYALVLSAPAGDYASNYVLWGIDSGGGLADAVENISTNGGLTWSSGTPADCLFEVWGNSAIYINSANIFQSYKESNDWLILADVTNIYEPYYPDQDASLHFQLQLINGSTVVSSTPFKAWSRQPLAIYLNTDTSNTLTWGNGYKVRIQNTDSSTVYFEYALVSVDWISGGNYFLDSAIRAMASSLETYYSTVYLTNIVQQTDKVLNDSGAVIFMRGIPYIQALRPNLFETAYHVGSSATAKSITATTDWSTALGPRLTAGIATVAGWFGSDAEGFFAWIELFIGLILGIIVMLATRSTSGVFLGLVFAGCGALAFGGIPIAIVVGVGAICGIPIVLWMAGIIFRS